MSLSSDEDDEPVLATEAPPPTKRGWMQFSLGKLMLLMALVSLVGALVFGAFRAQENQSFPIYVVVAAAGPLVILIIAGAARAILFPSKKKRRRW